MLQSGRYKAEHDGDVFHTYRYVMEVKETEKSYVFKLVETVNRYADDQIEHIFGKNGRAVLRKDKPSRYAIRVWGDDSFTIYPFRVGIPFYFKLEEV